MRKFILSMLFIVVSMCVMAQAKKPTIMVIPINHTPARTTATYIEMEMYDGAIDKLNAIPQIDAELKCYKNSIDILNKISVEQQKKSNNNIKNESPDVAWIND